MSSNKQNLMLVCGALVMGMAGSASGAIITTADGAGVTDFNAYIFGSATIVDSEIGGRLAIGGSATLNSTNVGGALVPAKGDRDDVIVGGSLSTGNLTVVSGGNVRYAGRHNGRAWVHGGGGMYQAASPFDFGSIQKDLTVTSDALASFGSTGDAAMEWGGITLTGTSPGLNVFSVPGEWFRGANNFTLDVPSGSTVLVNIMGEEIDMANQGWTLRGAVAERVLLNMPEARTVTVSSVAMYGSLLAPGSSVSMKNAKFAGTVAADSLDVKGMSFQPAAFSGSFDAVPSPGGAVVLALGGLAASRRRR